MAEATVLEVLGLEVRYGSVPAVRGLSFDVARGEIVALVARMEQASRRPSSL